VGIGKMEGEKMEDGRGSEGKGGRVVVG